MGINPTPTNHRAFTYDGKSTREFGVYITGECVFNAPERAVEMISIPGRDGEYALDQGHFNNIEVTYRAGIVSDSATDFAEAISDFRNWLSSREGYCRLSDEYNPDEYRMAVFKNVITVEHEGLETGEFDITFNCKPQRWLTSGETAVTVTSGGTITNPTLFDSKPLLAVEGYGSIGFNGYEISIDSGVIGDITLASDVNNTSVTINEDGLNIGDTISVRAERNFYIVINDEYGLANRRASEVITDSNGNFSTEFQSQSVTTYDMESDFYYKTTSAINFVSGTTSTATDNVSGTITVKNKNNTSFTVTFSLTIKIKYDATAHTIVETVSNMSVTTPPEYIAVSGQLLRQSFVFKSVIGDSTISRLGNPTYIDCDIGEAYMETGGSIVSLNQYIDLGSDLPTLPSGDTEVTYDNTITKVEVKPNWWKV